MALSGVSTEDTDDHLQRRRNVSGMDAAKIADVSQQHANQIITRISKQTIQQECSPVPRIRK